MTPPSEHIEQVTLVSAFRKKYPGTRIFAIPNGGLRGKLTAQKLKMEGVSSGIPDLYIPEYRCWIEMKRKTGGRLSDAQKDWIEYLERIGDKVIVAKGWEDAMKAFSEWIETSKF